VLHEQVQNLEIPSSESNACIESESGNSFHMNEFRYKFYKFRSKLFEESKILTRIYIRYHYMH